jgi:hypothetical protein
MTHISVHDTKQEWESNHGEDSRVDFLVHWDTIGVYNLLEWPSEFVAFDISGWLNSMVFISLEICCGVLS